MSYSKLKSNVLGLIVVVLLLHAIVASFLVLGLRDSGDNSLNTSNQSIYNNNTESLDNDMEGYIFDVTLLPNGAYNWFDYGDAGNGYILHVQWGNLIDYGQIKDKNPPKLVRIGYMFRGFFYKYGGNFVEYINADYQGIRPWDIAQYGVQLQAMWIPLQSNIKFDLNVPDMSVVDTPSVANIVVVGEFGDEMRTTWFTPNGREYPLILPQRNDGFEFLGFYITPNGESTLGGNSYSDPDKQYYKKDIEHNMLLPASEYLVWDCNLQTFPNDVQDMLDIVNTKNEYTLYARWKSPATKIILDNAIDDDNGITYEIVGYYGEKLPKLNSIPQRKGHTFEGYYDELNYDIDKKGNQYYDSNGDACKEWDKYIDKTYVLYAYWIPKTYSVILNHAGGFYIENNIATIKFKYGSEISLLGIPQYNDREEKKVFNGYYDDKGTMYFNKYMASSTDKYEYDRDLCLYADWISGVFKVSFELNGGEWIGIDGIDGIDGIVGEKLTDFAVAPTKIGHEFVGFFDNNYVQYYDRDMKCTRIWDINEDTILQADWIKQKYTITIDLKGGEGISELTVLFGDMLKWEIPTKDGYKFVGLYDKLNGEGNEYYNNKGATKPYEINGDTTLFVYWQDLNDIGNNNVKDKVKIDMKSIIVYGSIVLSVLFVLGIVVVLISKRKRV